MTGAARCASTCVPSRRSITAGVSSTRVNTLASTPIAPLLLTPSLAMPMYLPTESSAARWMFSAPICSRSQSRRTAVVVGDLGKCDFASPPAPARE
jgi:hypothetical protein